MFLEKQLERFEWQLRILKEVLSADGNPERAELLKEHAEEDVCCLVLNILDKVMGGATTQTKLLCQLFQPFLTVNQDQWFDSWSCCLLKFG